MRHYEAQAEVRKHYYLDEYVAIAPKRTHSLHYRDYSKTGILKSPPLENESSILEIPGPNGQWAVKVIRNLYPAFSFGNPKAYGAQEVILEANPADISFGQLPVEQIMRLFSAYQQRLEALFKLKEVKYISIFHNDGLEAGASIKQTHSQLVAMGLIPPLLEQQNAIYNKLRRQYGHSPLARAMTWEQQQKNRIIYQDRYVLAVAPYASQHPYEVWLVPRREVVSIRDLKDSELKALAITLKAIVLTLNSEQIPFNFLLQDQLRGHHNHFYIRITPRPNIWAGFELNTGIPINPVSAEEAADWYRRFCQEHNAL